MAWLGKYKSILSATLSIVQNVTSRSTLPDVSRGVGLGRGVRVAFGSGVVANAIVEFEVIVGTGASRRVGILQRVANSNAVANKIIAIIFLDMGYLAGDLTGSSP